MALTVVLADDHPVVLAGVHSLLSQSNSYHVLATAPNGREALRLIRELRPDIAVLDMSMPELTGLQVLEELQEEGPPTRVVFLTAAAEDREVAGAIAAGAWGIMLKATAGDELLACLTQVDAGHRWLPQEITSPALEREAVRKAENAEYDSVLSAREREIATLVAQGLSNKEISRKTGISDGTVKIHLHNVYRKLNVANRTALATLARRYWMSGLG
jgi:DNA-binding NarL/FixJ family response regulator